MFKKITLALALLVALSLPGFAQEEPPIDETVCGIIGATRTASDPCAEPTPVGGSTFNTTSTSTQSSGNLTGNSTTWLQTLLSYFGL